MKIIQTLVLLAFSLPATAQDFETVPAGEPAAIDAVRKMIAGALEKEFAAEGGVARRDAHGKHHGCLRADLKVKALPGSLAQGLFKEEGTFPAWIRLSNGGGKPKPDSEGDGRGFALKVMNVTGARVDSSEKETQDFLFINNPTFFVKNAPDYVEFQKAVIDKGSPLSFFMPGVNPLNWRVREFRNANAIQKKEVNDPLAIQYFSMTPFLFGKNEAAKFSVRPCVEREYKSDRTHPNFLRESLRARMSDAPVCYEFLVQKQRGEMPIEDPTEEWSEKESPFIKIAQIEIPKQSFESKAQMDFCENLTFNPWHSLEDHRPLGGINRARKTVYETIAELRLKLNNETRTEPTGFEKFD